MSIDHISADDANSADGEGVWSPEIEQSFQEALLLFPPCGRRKHILQEAGDSKMYGRNELIARHIQMRTGKSRTRKQVSSHIQVLARRKAKSEAPAASTSATPSPSVLRGSGTQSAFKRHDDSQSYQAGYLDVWADRPIITQKIRLVEFSAFIERRNFHHHHHLHHQTTNSAGISNLIQPIQSPNTTSPATAAATMATLAANALTNGPNNAADLDFGQLQTATNKHQTPDQMQPSYSTPHQYHAAHPLASNHHLSAQFNQASYLATNHNHNHNHNHHHHHHHNNDNNNHHHNHRHSQHQQGQMGTPVTNNHLSQLQQPLSSAGFTRHSYVQIDYSQTLSTNQQRNKLERIDISEIQDKFPEIGGTTGLFQRGPPDAFFLIKFWADINTDDFKHNIDDQNSYFGFSNHFETVDPYEGITCLTKACSYGNPMVEKVDKIYGSFNNSNGRYSYDINSSEMCEFMIQFIKKLRQLTEVELMNSVLENFTVLQVITRKISDSSSEILLCLAYVFEVAPLGQSNGPQYHVYKLTKD